MLQNSLENAISKMWNEHDLSLIDRLFHERVVIHSLLGTYYGPQAMRRMVESWLRAFPDLKVQHLYHCFDRDRLVIQWDATATHCNELKGIPATHQRVYYSGVSIYRLNDSQVVEYWAYIDMDNLLNQLRETQKAIV